MAQEQPQQQPAAQTALSVYKDPAKYNVLMPLDEIQQIAPWHAARITQIQVSTDPRKGDVYKVGKRKTEDGQDEEDLFALTKGPLMQIAQGAGIIFNWDQHGVESEVYDSQGRLLRIRWKTVGMLRMPDGTFRPIPGTKDINLSQDADKMRLEAFNSLRDYGTYGAEAKRWEKRTVAETGKPVGHWEKVTKKGFAKPLDTFFFDDRAALEEAVEDRIQPAIIQRRIFAPALAETGAMLRMIRSALGLKTQMTKDELSKPFVIPRIEFSPDYNDPNVRAAVIQHGLGAMSTLFGQARQGTGLGAGDMADGHIALSAGDPAPMETAGQQTGPIQDPIDVTAPPGEKGPGAEPDLEPDDDPLPWMGDDARPAGPKCKACGEEIQPKTFKQGGQDMTMTALEVAAKMKEKFGSELCWGCGLAQRDGGN